MISEKILLRSSSTKFSKIHPSSDAFKTFFYPLQNFHQNVMTRKKCKNIYKNTLNVFFLHWSLNKDTGCPNKHGTEIEYLESNQKQNVVCLFCAMTIRHEEMMTYLVSFKTVYISLLNSYFIGKPCKILSLICIDVSIYIIYVYIILGDLEVSLQW